MVETQESSKDRSSLSTMGMLGARARVVRLPRCSDGVWPHPAHTPRRFVESPDGSPLEINPYTHYVMAAQKKELDKFVDISSMVRRRQFSVSIRVVLHTV